MPQQFDSCEKAGGKIRTVSGPNRRFGLKAGEYVKICFMNGKMFRGYMETKGRDLKDKK